MADLFAHRRLLVGGALAAYVLAVFAAFTVFEVPGLGIGHFFYIPIALLALASGPRVGLLAGIGAAGLYTLGSALNASGAPGEPLVATTIRVVTYSAIGTIVGWSARSNRILLERLREHAERDFLTGLLNVRAFETELNERLASSRPFALILGDVDDLKLINDRDGHAAGNDHLRRLATALRAEVAPHDVVARVGGDEFAVLAWVESRPGADAEAGRLAGMLRDHGISMSVGWAVRPEDGTDSLGLFHAADKRLYRDKLDDERRVRARLRSVG
jgi:diguanylate cyclase (GGDEF)-like protein